jgi:fructose/tagatose bisphosphate aldolase
LRQAIKIGIRKVNLGSALKQAFFRALSEACHSRAASSNPYEIIGSGLASDVLVAGRIAMQSVCAEWMTLLGSSGRA